MGVHIVGGSEREGGVWSNGNIHLEKSEYVRVVYYNAADSGPVRGGREEAGGTGGYAMMEKGGTWTAGIKETAAAAAEADRDGMEE